MLGRRFSISTTTPGGVKNDYDLYNVTLTYDAAIARVLSTTSYLTASTPVWNQAFTFQESPPGTAPPDAFYVPFQIVDDHLLTEELRLSSIGTGPLQWTIGGFYRHFRDLSESPLQYFGDESQPLPASYGANSLETLFKAWSVFGDVSYKLSDRLTIGAGVRDFREDQQATDFVNLTTQTAKFSSVDPRVYTQYKVTDDVNVYVQRHAKGFRSGGFNVAGQPPFGPESVWTYEIGTKMSLFERHVDLDLAIFSADYSDYQTFGVVPGTPSGLAANVGRARSKEH